VPWTLFLYCNRSAAQELYIHAEPASNIPKKVIGMKALTANYQGSGLSTQWYGLRGMYGITAKWMVMLTGSLSDQHGNELPSELFQSTGIYLPQAQRYPLQFEGINFYSKYRLYSSDEMNKHFRIALYGEYGYNKTVYVNAEPNLSGDNTGVGGGLIITKLSNKLAVSGTAGFILPQWYNEQKTNLHVKSGNAFTYSLSAGYLLYPKTYTNYKQTNINAYIEGIGKAYGDALYKNGEVLISKTRHAVYKAGSYIDIRPGVQFIFNSNLRLDVSTTALQFSRNREGDNFATLFLAVQYYLIPK